MIASRNITEKNAIPGNRTTFLILGLILALALWLRVLNLDLLMPYFVNADELRIILSALNILETGDLNPHNFKYGGFTIYLGAFVYWVYFHLAAVIGGKGLASVPGTIASFQYWDGNFILFYLGRGLCVLASLASLVLTFMIGKRLFGRSTGLLSALFVGILPLSVERAQMFNPDILLTLWALAVLYFSVRVHEEGNWKHYLAAAFFAGLAMATKYNFLILVPLGLAHFLRPGNGQGEAGRPRFFDVKIWLALYFSVLIFFLFSPYVFLDWSRFLREMVPFFGFAQNAHFSYLESLIYRRYLFQLLLLFPLILSPFLYLAAIWGGVALARDSWRTAALLLGFPLGYFLFVGAITQITFHQHFLPLLPFAAVPGSWLLLNLLSDRNWKKGIGIFLLSGALIFSLSDTVYPQYRPLYTIQNELGQWIERNVKTGEKVLLTGWFFRPADNFWQGNRERIPEPLVFDEEIVRSGRYDYIITLGAPALESDAGFFSSRNAWRTYQRLRKGDFPYRLEHEIGFPPLWDRLAGRVFPLARDFRFVIFKAVNPR